MSRIHTQLNLKYVRNHSHGIYAAMMSWTIFPNLNQIIKKEAKTSYSVTVLLKPRMNQTDAILLFSTFVMGLGTL